MSLLLVVIYLAFISLGLPDALLGSAWPKMYVEFNVPLSYAGCISMIISAGTVVSSLQSDRLTKKFGTGIVSAMSVALTAIALFGFSISHNFINLCLWSIPYGLGAGSIDAALNNYVALHYKSKHMSWLHCMWGIGATVGPYIMGLVLTRNYPWNYGYRIISVIQVILTAIIIFSLPMWKKDSGNIKNNANENIVEEQKNEKVLSIKEVLNIMGAKEIMISFFCYSAIEQTTMLWASSYLNLGRNVEAEMAATFAAMFCIGITIGRGINGFVAMKLNDKQMIHMGQVIILIGIIIIILPIGSIFSIVGLSFVGIGCAPIYPSIIHSTPSLFGAKNSQAVIGMQMAFAYISNCFIPPLFGVIANNISIKILPFYILFFLIVMIVLYERLLHKVGKSF